jgi:hypothetical protein
MRKFFSDIKFGAKLLPSDQTSFSAASSGTNAPPDRKSLRATAKELALKGGAKAARKVAEFGVAATQPVKLFLKDAPTRLAEAAEEKLTGTLPPGADGRGWHYDVGARLERTRRPFFSKDKKAKKDARTPEEKVEERTRKGRKIIRRSGTLIEVGAGAVVLAAGLGGFAVALSNEAQPEKSGGIISKAKQDDSPRRLPVAEELAKHNMEIKKGAAPLVVKEIPKEVVQAAPVDEGVPAEMVPNGDSCTIYVRGSQFRQCLDGQYQLRSNMYLADGKLGYFDDGEEDPKFPDGSKLREIPKGAKKIVENGNRKYKQITFEFVSGGKDGNIIDDACVGERVMTVDDGSYKNALASRWTDGSAGLIYQMENFDEAIANASVIDEKTGVTVCDENTLHIALGNMFDKASGIISNQGAPIDPYNNNGGGSYRDGGTVRSALRQETHRTNTRLADYEAEMDAKAKELSWAFEVHEAQVNTAKAEDSKPTRPVRISPRIRMGDSPEVDAVIDAVKNMMKFTERLHDEGIAAQPLIDDATVGPLSSVYTR